MRHRTFFNEHIAATLFTKIAIGISAGVHELIKLDLSAAIFAALPPVRVREPPDNLTISAPFLCHEIMDIHKRVSIAEVVYLLAATIYDEIWDCLAGDFAGDLQFCF